MQNRISNAFMEEDLHLLCDVFCNYLRCSLSITRGDGIFIAANPMCEKVFGFTASDYIGRPTVALQDAGIFKPSIALQALKTRQAISTTLADKSGFTRPIDAIPLFDPSGNIRYILCFSAWDVTSYEELQTEYQRLESELARYTSEVHQLRANNNNISSVVTENAQMKRINQLIAQIAPYSACVLFSGPSGVGKVFYAKKLHSMGKNPSGPFIEVNCRTVPERIIEFEIFGNAEREDIAVVCGKHIGALKQAEGGTLLLKEIDCLSLGAQSRLASVMAEAQDGRQGNGEEGKCIQTRILATTGKNLQEMAAGGFFSDALYYLLGAIPIDIPPLQDRPEDLLAFILHYLEKKNAAYNLEKQFSQQALNKMLEYSWPGNIREVCSIMERLLLTTTENLIQAHNLPDYINGVSAEPHESGSMTLKQILEFHEKRIFVQAYEKHKTTVAVAKSLGISQPSAARKLAKYKPASK